jgi:hypothetical protein
MELKKQAALGVNVAEPGLHVHSTEACPVWGRLKHQLQRELNLARGAGKRRNGPEIRITHVLGRSAQVGRVEQIEKFGAKLQPP